MQAVHTHTQRDIASISVILHDAELQALVERDDTAARLPAPDRVQEAGSDKCTISTDEEAAVSVDESSEIRCDHHSSPAADSGQHVIMRGAPMPAWRLLWHCQFTQHINLMRHSLAWCLCTKSASSAFCRKRPVEAMMVVITSLALSLGIMLWALIKETILAVRGSNTSW